MVSSSSIWYVQAVLFLTFNFIVYKIIYFSPTSKETNKQTLDRRESEEMPCAHQYRRKHSKQNTDNTGAKIENKWDLMKLKSVCKAKTA